MDNAADTSSEDTVTEDTVTRGIEEKILSFLEQELLGPNMTASREDDLLSGEVLDSVAVLRLASYVAEEFRMNIQPSDFVVENFQNVGVIAQYVLRSTNSSA